VRLRLGTRGSRLALIQAEEVAAPLRARGVEVEIAVIRTSGDRLAQVALADFGGKALFVEEIEDALLEGRIDLAVHSLKDVPGRLPAGLCLAAFPPRADAADALVTRDGRTLAELPAGAAVGTSSLRRQVLLRARRPDVRGEPIRGNVDTRLRKLEDGQYDALVLAMAGLARLGLALPGARRLAVEEFMPAVGQGTIAVEARAEDRDTLAILSAVDHTDSRVQAEAERAFVERLDASCHAPVAGHAQLAGGALSVTGMVASADGARMLTASVSGPASAARGLGEKLADELLARGARALLGTGGGS
jgi:hydroxymethylbilane synthase